MADLDARLIRWDQLACDRPMPRVDRRRVIGAHAMISHLVLHKGFRLDRHAHENEQFSVVLEGRVRMTIETDAGPRTFEVGPGELLHLPPNVPHAAEALETTVVLDIFAPPSAATGVDAAPPG